MSQPHAEAVKMWREHALKIVRSEAESSISQRKLAWRFLKKHGLFDAPKSTGVQA